MLIVFITFYFAEENWKQIHFLFLSRQLVMALWMLPQCIVALHASNVVEAVKVLSMLQERWVG